MKAEFNLTPKIMAKLQRDTSFREGDLFFRALTKGKYLLESERWPIARGLVFFEVEVFNKKVFLKERHHWYFKFLSAFRAIFLFAFLSIPVGLTFLKFEQRKEVLIIFVSVFILLFVFIHLIERLWLKLGGRSRVLEFFNNQQV